MITTELLIDADLDWQTPNFGQGSEENLRHKFSQWLQSVPALTELVEGDASVVIRLINGKTSQELNEKYRNKHEPTNVLSFPIDRQRLRLPAEIGTPLGDLAICWRVVVQEAQDRNIPLLDHLAHLAIHGYLHLLGFDHQELAEQQFMESVEIEALANLGIADPYLIYESP